MTSAGRTADYRQCTTPHASASSWLIMKLARMPQEVAVYPHISSRQLHTEQRRKYWDLFARSPWKRDGMRRYYRQRLAEVYAFLIPPGSRILELGCGQGDLLAALRPSYGLGVDFSPEMLARAREKHPSLRFLECDVHEF